LLRSTDGEISSDPLRKELVTLFVQLKTHISIYDRETVPSHLRLPLSGFEGMEAVSSLSGISLTGYDCAQGAWRSPPL